MPLVEEACRVFNEPAVSCLCRLACCSRSPANAQVPTTSGHTCLTQGNNREFRDAEHSGTASLRLFIRCPALALRVHSQLPRWQAWVAETDSAVNHYGQLRAENPRPISVSCGPCLPLAFVGSLDRRAYDNS